MADLAAQKRAARKVAGSIRVEAHAMLGDTAGASLVEAGRAVLASMTPGIVSGFFPYRSEINALPLLAELAKMGWTTALPVVIAPAQPLVFRSWQPGEATIAGVWDIPVPVETAPEIIPDVMLVPLLSFDAQGFRLGYGGGFYDRTFASLRETGTVTGIGVAYSTQEVDAVPCGVHDVPLDWVLTEDGPKKPV